MKKYICYFLLFFNILVLNIAFTAQISKKDQLEAVKFINNYKKSKNKLPLLLRHSNSSNEGRLYFVAKNLGNFNDPKAIGVLKKLLKYKQKNRQMRSISACARNSLEKINSSSSLAKIINKVVAELTHENLANLQKYALGTNRYAQRTISKYLFKNIKDSPSYVLPLLVKYFPYERGTSHYVRKYPNINIDSALKYAVKSINTSIISGALKIMRIKNNFAAMSECIQFIYADRQKVSNSTIRMQLLVNLREGGNASLPWLSGILHSRNVLAQYEAVNCLELIGTPEALKVLQEFLTKYRNYGSKSGEIITKINNAIALLESKIR